MKTSSWGGYRTFMLGFFLLQALMAWLFSLPFFVLAQNAAGLGKKVLLILDSLTRVAHAAREIGMLLGEPGAARGYPPSALSTITKLIERAGNSAQRGGAITGIYTVLADGDDQNDPVVDTGRVGLKEAAHQAWRIGEPRQVFEQNIWQIHGR